MDPLQRPRGSWGEAVLWLSVAVIGQLASLLMIDAGPVLRYQHYRPIGRLVAETPWLVAALGVQTLLVAGGLLRWLNAARGSLGRLPLLRIGVVLLLAVATAATVSPDPRRYVAELVLAAFIQLVNLATIALFARAVPATFVRTLIERMPRWRGEAAAPAQPFRLDRFAWTVASLVVVAAAVLNLTSYERHPHVPDEVVYLYHARYFAEGQMTMAPPPVPAAFDVDLMSYEPTRWYSPVPPGWPAVLAAGVFVGAPWLVNPVLAGVCVLLTYVLLGGVYSRRVARTATLLLAASPWFLFLGMSYMTHMMTLACALVAAVGIMRARESGSLVWSLAAGLGVGAISWIRPLDAVLVGLLMAAWAMGLGGRRLRVPALAALLAGTVAGGAAIFPYNKALTGDPLVFPINLYADKLYGPNSNAYGFGKDRGLGWAFDPNPGHSPFDALVNANLNTFGINTDLLGWSTGSLVLLAAFLVFGRWSRADRLMLATGAVIFTGYFFYYFSGGPDYGARYWFPIIVPLVALSARGLDTLEALLTPRVAVAAAVLTVMALGLFVPWRAIDKYHQFRGMRPDVRRLAAAHGFDGDLVLIAGSRFPDYASAIIENPIDLTGGATVYAWDRTPEVRADLLRAFPGRRVWLVNGPSITKGAFAVAAGPLRAESLVRSSDTTP